MTTCSFICIFPCSTATVRPVKAWQLVFADGISHLPHFLSLPPSPTAASMENTDPVYELLYIALYVLGGFLYP